MKVKQTNDTSVGFPALAYDQNRNPCIIGSFVSDEGNSHTKYFIVTNLCSGENQQVYSLEFYDIQPVGTKFELTQTAK